MEGRWRELPREDNQTRHHHEVAILSEMAIGDEKGKEEEQEQEKEQEEVQVQEQRETEREEWKRDLLRGDSEQQHRDGTVVEDEDKKED